MTGAYEELIQTGRAGPVALRMLLDVGRQSVRARNYPAPHGDGAWSEDDVAELVHEMVLACSQGASFVDTLLSAAADEQSLRAVVAHRIMLAFSNRSRETDTGHLTVRIRKLLRASDQFTLQPDGRWQATGVIDPANGAGHSSAESLLRAAFAVPDIKVTRWSELSERRAPFAAKSDLERLCAAVITAAGGSIADVELIKILADYFGLRPGTVSVADAESDIAPSAAPDPATNAVADSFVQLIWEQLNDDERRMLPWLSDSLSQAALALNIGRTTAHGLRLSTRTIIIRALGLRADAEPIDLSNDEAELVLTQLQILASSGESE